MEDFSAWIGRSEMSHDTLAETPLRGLAALLDVDVAGWSAAAPPLAHWLYFLQTAPQSHIDVDGHPKRAGLLPPITLPRRMWAGGRLEFIAPLRVGAELRRQTTIADIKTKQGASGPLVFVTLRHAILDGDAVCLNEEQDIVYRAAPSGGAPSVTGAAEAMPAPDHVTRLKLDPTQLFRFSALTFNAHRIHYDRDYARDVEGYGGLVVHGPYLATLLMHHFLSASRGKAIRSFSFRALSPLLDTDVFDLCLAWREDAALLWTQTKAGIVTMRAEIVAA